MSPYPSAYCFTPGSHHRPTSFRTTGAVTTLPGGDPIFQSRAAHRSRAFGSSQRRARVKLHFGRSSKRLRLEVPVDDPPPRCLRAKLVSRPLADEDKPRRSTAVARSRLYGPVEATAWTPIEVWTFHQRPRARYEQNVRDPRAAHDEKTRTTGGRVVTAPASRNLDGGGVNSAL
jgi:hypothetical protein